MWCKCKAKKFNEHLLSHLILLKISIENSSSYRIALCFPAFDLRHSTVPIRWLKMKITTTRRLQCAVRPCINRSSKPALKGDVVYQNPLIRVKPFAKVMWKRCIYGSNSNPFLTAFIFLFYFITNLTNVVLSVNPAPDW